MSALSSDSLVLITGANGHIAQHVIDQLLGHPARPRVRGTVRSPEAAELLKTHWNSYVDEGRLDVVRVPNIVSTGAFIEALKGATHVVHIASPLVLKADSVEEDIIKPAVQGTVNLLDAATKEPSVKAVAITSSLAALFDAKKSWRPEYTYTVADWNPMTYEEAASPDLDLTTFPPQLRHSLLYCASKKLAEQSAWDYHRTHLPSYTLTALNPVYIAGPSVLPLPNGAGSLSLSTKLVWRCATDKEIIAPQDHPYWVDVRDVAKAHVAAIEQPEAAGKRLPVVGRGDHLC